MLNYRYDGKLLKYPTGVKMLPSEWDKIKDKLENLRENRSVPLKGDIAFNLKKTLTEADRICINFKNANRELTPRIFKEELDIALEVKKKQKYEKYFVAYFEKFFEDQKQKRGFAKVKTIGSTISLIKKAFPKWDMLTFEDINYTFYDTLDRYMLYNDDKKYSVNYFGNMIRNVKQAMNHAIKEGYTDCIHYQKFKRLTEDVDEIYLSNEEIKLLREAELTISEDLVRDCFLILCYTGLRDSDLKTLTTANIIGDYQTIYKRNQKTGKVTIIPISPIVKSIFEKHNGIPKVVSNQRMNKILKTIGKKAKINREVAVARKEKGELKTTVYKAYDLIGTHTGRRTGLTHMYLNEMNLFEIISISGHSKVAQLQRYLRISSQEVADKVKENKFFKAC